VTGGVRREGLVSLASCCSDRYQVASPCCYVPWCEECTSSKYASPIDRSLPASWDVLNVHKIIIHCVQKKHPLTFSFISP